MIFVFTAKRRFFCGENIMRVDTRERNQLFQLENDAINKLQRDFPSLYWDRFVFIDTSTTRLGIDDISYRTSSSIQEDVELMQIACKGWLEIIDAKDLTRALEEKLKKLFRALNPRKTIVVFPGIGAQVVKDLLSEDLTKGMGIINISTKRIVSRNGSIQGVELYGKTALRQEVTDRKTETIVVVDDVIVTGSTLTAIQSAVPARNIEWFGASLMALSPLQGRGAKTASGVEGYKSIITPVVYQGLTGIPPLNSLSTLVGASPKSEIVRGDYIMNYVNDIETFMNAVNQIQEKMKGGSI